MILVFDTHEECDKFTKLYETYGKTIYLHSNVTQMMKPL